MRRLLLAAVALATVAAGVVAPPIVPDASAAGRIPGIDVSRWQGTIDWRRVAASGVKFAGIKATEGTTWVDPRYATNRENARRAGIRVMAYHFARPDASVGDAVREADHFLRTAKVRSGDLLPVLDLEQHGGLNRLALVRWAQAFVGRIKSRLGVRPIVYTYPSFWRTYTRNEDWFGLQGYRLWIAHYGVSSPSVPGENWGGRGWTIWQWTQCGRVPGIAGCVDRNWYRGSWLSSIRI